MIGAELRLKAVRRVAKWSRHYAGVRNDGVEEVAFCKQLVGASSYILKAGEVELNQLERSAFGFCILSHLCRRHISLGQVPYDAHNVCAVHDKRSSSLNSDPG